MVALKVYRGSAIGRSLTETLDELVRSGKLTPELASKVLLQFDESMTAALEHQNTSRAFFKGSLHSYRHCDSIWTFNLRDVAFSNNEISENVNKLKIVAHGSNLRKPKVPPHQQ